MFADEQEMALPAKMEEANEVAKENAEEKAEMVNTTLPTPKKRKGKKMPFAKKPAEKKKENESTVLNLNNEVTKMRKEVKRVRALVIRKLTRQIASLRKKKGNPTEVERNQRRAQRLLEEIHALKTLKPDPVTKAALQKNMNFELVCKDPSCSISDRAVARIATHRQFAVKIEAIKAAVKAFKEERMKEIKQTGKKVKVKQPLGKVTEPSEDGDLGEKENEGEREKEQKEERAEETRDVLIVNKEPSTDIASETDMQTPGPKDTVTSHQNEETSGPNSTLTTQENKEISVPKDVVTAQENKEMSVPKDIVTAQENKEISVPTDTVTVQQNQEMLVPKNAVTAHQNEEMLEVQADDADAASKGIMPASVMNPKIQNLVKNMSQSDNAEKKAAPKSSSGKITTKEKNVDEKYESEGEESEEDDLESSDDEVEKEYFDDSTEERFRNQSSVSEGSDSEDDFFLGKVRKFKKKKSSSAHARGEGEKQKEPKGDSEEPLETSDRVQGELDELESRLNSKAPKLKSTFCSTLSASTPKWAKQNQGSGGRGDQRVGHSDRSSNGPSRFKSQGNKTSGVGNGKDPGYRRADLEDKGSVLRGRGRGRGEATRPQGSRGRPPPSHQAPQQTLHPSWEASKRRKEQQGQILAFQGKKIKFDD